MDRQIMVRLSIGFILLFGLINIVMVHSFKEGDWIFEILPIEEAPIKVISENESLPRQENCTYFECFDIYRCNVLAKEISVFVYPITRFVDSTGMSVTPSHSLEFQQLLQAIVQSKYYTSNPEEACLFIPSIDLLTQKNIDIEATNQALESLPFWRETGSNHLLFNMVPGSFPDYNRVLDVKSGKAIIAGGGFDSWTYRPDFDVSIPVFSPLVRTFKPSKEMIKKLLLVSTQFDAVSSDMKLTLQSLASSHSPEIFSVFSSKCHFFNQTEGERRTESRDIKICDRTGTSISYTDVLSQATFCLLLPTAFLSSPTLSDILMTSCIPVIVSDEVILPFPEKIDWNRGSIRIHEFLLPSVIKILEGVSNKDRKKMTKYGKEIFDTYFSSMERMALTALGIINDRIIVPGSVSQEEEEEMKFPPCDATK